MDMRDGASESPMSQLSQEFLFVFIALLKKILHHLKVGGNPFWGDIKWHFFEISELKNHQKNQKFFVVQNFHQSVFMSSPVTLRRRNTFFMEYVTAQTHNHFKLYQGSKIIVSFQNYDNLCQKKKWEFLSKIWTQKFGYYCLFRGLFERVVGFCSDILHKKVVSASKSHRGRHKNKWKQSDENFEQNFFFWFFWWFFS